LENSPAIRTSATIFSPPLEKRAGKKVSW
jgi:hypothetical protein